MYRQAYVEASCVGIHGLNVALFCLVRQHWEGFLTLKLHAVTWSLGPLQNAMTWSPAPPWDEETNSACHGQEGGGIRRDCLTSRSLCRHGWPQGELLAAKWAHRSTDAPAWSRASCCDSDWLQ